MCQLDIVLSSLFQTGFSESQVVLIAPAKALIFFYLDVVNNALTFIPLR